mmetsp:Transcript_56709/g.133097  ORF Transcript_56709/g.133097 Transcript_56709/m.133097 type:complete len:296 (-) Transcript_56709:1221-2108(-)
MFSLCGLTTLGVAEARISLSWCLLPDANESIFVWALWLICSLRRGSMLLCNNWCRSCGRLLTSSGGRCSLLCSLHRGGWKLRVLFCSQSVCGTCLTRPSILSLLCPHAIVSVRRRCTRTSILSVSFLLSRLNTGNRLLVVVLLFLIPIVSYMLRRWLRPRVIFFFLLRCFILRGLWRWRSFLFFLYHSSASSPIVGNRGWGSICTFGAIAISVPFAPAFATSVTTLLIRTAVTAGPVRCWLSFRPAALLLLDGRRWLFNPAVLFFLFFSSHFLFLRLFRLICISETFHHLRESQP